MNEKVVVTTKQMVQHQSMLISAANSKGGVGKTTISTHLAHWFHLYDYETVLVDCDAQRLSSRWLAMAAPELPTIVLEKPSEIDESLPKLQKQFEVVIVDAPGGLGEATGAILTHTDAVLIPTGASNLDIMALEWVSNTVHEIQRIRDGAPQGVIIPMRVARQRLTTRNLLNEAKNLGLCFTNSTLPYREIYAQVAGLKNRMPKLLWQLGRSKAVRKASLEMDALFQEVFPEACEHDITRIARLVTPRTKQIKEPDQDNEKRIANA